MDPVNNFIKPAENNPYANTSNLSVSKHPFMTLVIIQGNSSQYIRIYE